MLGYNRGRRRGSADGIVITPSHNPPRYGGFKYDPPHGGPADTHVTRWIEERANALLADGLRGVATIPFDRASVAPTTHKHEYLDAYVRDLESVVDLDAIRASKVRIGVDPLGGASVAYWDAIGERYGLDLEVVNRAVDPKFGFMTVDWDGQIRMDPSSPYAMAPHRRLEGPVRRRVRERHRRRSPRRRDPQRGTPRAEPLPRGRDRIPLRQPPRVARFRRRRQDRRQQQHDRSSGGASRDAD